MKDSQKTITLRRDKKGPLKFNGQRIGQATRTQERQEDDDETWHTYQVTLRLFQTSGGKYVLGLEVRDETEERFEAHDGWMAHSLGEFAEALKEIDGNRFLSKPSDPFAAAKEWLDKDILAEVFEDTELADLFVEHID